MLKMEQASLFWKNLTPLALWYQYTLINLGESNKAALNRKWPGNVMTFTGFSGRGNVL